MDIILTALAAGVAWRVLCLRYQRARIALLGSHLANLRLERLMETLTQGYLRTIREGDETIQLTMLESFRESEEMVASQLRRLAETMRQESAEATAMGMQTICIPYIERLVPAMTRDFRALLRIHADGLDAVVNNDGHWSPKDRAFHLSAELYLFQHSCHWFCKSRGIANARLAVQHQVKHQKVLESVSHQTRSAYLEWMRSP